jgi:hypothetical protein
LADLHLDVLYERDPSGWLIGTRRTDRLPLFHLVRTVEGNRLAVSHSVSGDERREFEDGLSREPVLANLVEMEAQAPFLPVPRADYRGPAFRFPEPLRPRSGSAELISDPRDERVVPDLSWVREVVPAEHPLAAARNAAGEIVAVCHSARASERGAEAGVETAAEYRGLGLAVEVILAWAAALMAEERTPLYSTKWSNQASRAVARKLGLIQYGEDYHD